MYMYYYYLRMYIRGIDNKVSITHVYNIIKTSGETS